MLTTLIFKGQQKSLESLPAVLVQRLVEPEGPTSGWDARSEDGQEESEQLDISFSNCSGKVDVESDDDDDDSFSPERENLSDDDSDPLDLQR